MVEPHFGLHEIFNAPTDDFALCDPFPDVREVELLKFWGQPARRTVESSCLYERSTRGDAAMESCKEHERGLMRTRSSRPQPRILQLKATRKMGACSPKPLPSTNKQTSLPDVMVGSSPRLPPVADPYSPECTPLPGCRHSYVSAHLCVDRFVGHRCL